MKHLGDICKIHNAPNVWIVCGGSPCQDLSVAGLRKGLKHSDKGDDEGCCGDCDICKKAEEGEEDEQKNT